MLHESFHAFWANPGDALDPIPIAMLPNNEDLKITNCVQPLALAKYISTNDGWSYVMEAKNKDGYIANTSSSRIVFTMPVPADVNLLNFYVPYLRSYDMNSTAEISCLDGCTCEVITVNSFLDTHASIIDMVPVKTAILPSTYCSISISLKTDGKFKVTAIMNADSTEIMSSGLFYRVEGYNP